MSSITHITPIEYLKGVGPRKGELLRSELDIKNVNDLLQHYPFRYVDKTQFHKINQAHEQTTGVQIIGRLVEFQELGEKRSRRLVGRLADDTGTLELVWFRSIAWIKKNLQLNAVYIVYGKPSVFNSSLSITHPEMELYRSTQNQVGNKSLQPVYSTTEKLKKSGLDAKGIQKLQEAALQQVYRVTEETLPEYLLRQYKLMSYKEALRAIHFPISAEELHNAIRRLKFGELFFIQLKLLHNKQLNTIRFKGHVFSKVGDKFHAFFEEKLPFPLTNAQKRVLKEIRKDTKTGAQMNRLLQGDVGSGKTVVALMSMLMAIDNGYQACMMAPTEILAQQHFHGIRELLGDDFVEIRLLTGSTTAQERREIHTGLESGEVDVLIGTHALIEDKVQFVDLGLVIIDEQHRFGVEQRAKLWRKNKIPPHMLVMTATPIPRTLAMTLYGDLDISVIDELPAGRKPIETVHFFEKSRLRVFGFMREEIKKGRQIYVVYPLITESEKLDLLYLEAGLESLAQEFPLPEYRISIVHGKMTPKEKEFEMQRFVKGETHIMVATTVIEVGVNVPNASVMVIENAERFGLSQLHQLRGRVGRGAEQSYCILMSGNKLSKEGKERLSTMVRTNDGFEVAEVDLRLRGPGNLSGTQQSGVLELKIADLSQDQGLLTSVRQIVLHIFDKDPKLENDEHKVLLDYLNSKPTAITWDKIS